MPEEQEGFGEENEDLAEEQTNDDELRSVSSSMVSQWAYDRPAEQLDVFFVNGHEASYPCTPEQWEEAKGAASPGQWMHENVLSR